AAFLTAVSESSAPIFPPFLAGSSSSSHGGVSKIVGGSNSPPTPAASATKPAFPAKSGKPRTVRKYVAKLNPTKLKGKVIGDRGAAGKYAIKIV
ncbi:unnamed protein product, partial [Closterium sp. Naga37s-1]